MRKKFINFLFKLKSIIKSRLIIPILIILFIIIFFVYLIYGLFFGPAVPSRKKDFLSCVKEYTQVAKFYYDDFQKYDTDCLYYFTLNQTTNMGNDVACITQGYEHKLKLSNSIYNSFIKIEESYYLDKSYLESVDVYKGFVSFCNVNGRSSYVYSVNDNKPKYINSPNASNANERLYISKICDNWYYVCTRR